METQLPAEDMQPITHQHANGEIMAAANVEAAQRMCPVLGRLSLEEAGLLLELEAAGKQRQREQAENAAALAHEAKTPKHSEVENSKTKAERSADDILSRRTSEQSSGEAQPQQPEAKESASANLAVATADALERFVRESQEATERISNSDAEDSPLILDTPKAMSVADKPPKLETRAQQTKPAELKQQPARHTTEVVVPAAAEEVREQTLPIAEVILNEAAEIRPTGEPMLPEVPLEKHSEVLINAEVAPTETPLAEILTPDFQAPEEELPASHTEIVEAFSKLTEALDGPDQERSQAVHEILQEIINLPAQTDETVGNEEDITEEDKLEALLKELLEAAEIESSPELVRSFIILTQSRHNAVQLSSTEAKPDASLEEFLEIGTREFLQKLADGAGVMKRAILYFYKIGQSTLRLYSLAEAA